MRRSLIDILVHVVSTILLSTWVYQKTGNLSYVAILILTGIFLDLDHLIDYFIFFKNKFDLRALLEGLYLRSGKSYLIFHSWEINFILLIFGLGLKFYPLNLFVLGSSMHLAIDNIQRKNRLFYFLIYRFYRKFDALILLPEFKDKIGK